MPQSGRVLSAACLLALLCPAAVAQERADPGGNADQWFQQRNHIEVTAIANTLSVEPGQTLHITGMAIADAAAGADTIVLEVLLHGRVISIRVFRDVTLRAHQPVTITLNWKVQECQPVIT